jgi:hypothetical protein
MGAVFKMDTKESLPAEKVKFLYAELRSGDPERYKKLLVGGDADIESGDVRQVQLVGLLGRVATSVSFDEFRDFVTTGEMPTLKLSKKEMQVIAGGKWKASELMNIGAGLAAAGSMVLYAVEISLIT